MSGEGTSTTLAPVSTTETVTDTPDSLSVDDLGTWLYASVGVLGGLLVLLVICLAILFYKMYAINRTVKELKGTMDVYMRDNNQNLNSPQQGLQPMKPRQLDDDNFSGMHFAGDNGQSQAPRQVLPGRMGFQNQDAEREPHFGRPQSNNPQQPFKNAPQPLRLNLTEDNRLSGQSSSYRNPMAPGGGAPGWRDDGQNFNFGGLPRLNRNMPQSPTASDHQRSRQIGY